MNELQKLENLIAGHAYWSDKKKELKLQGGIEFYKCKRNDGSVEYMMTGKNCFELANEIYKNPADGFIDFDVVWTESDEFDPCCHCMKTRDLKKRRNHASMRLGVIRAAMTRLGRNIQYHDKGNLVTSHATIECDFDEDVPF